LTRYTYVFYSKNTIRLLSKADSWRSIWHSAKGSVGVFGVPAVSLSDEQRSLVSWSRLYDNIAESGEKPDKTVMDDDDLLDGWLIIQHKKGHGDGGANEELQNKHPGAHEVFIPVENQEDARRLENFNNPMGKMIKRQRSALIQKHGGVLEQDMPDSQMNMRMSATQQATQSAKGG
jgi:hypothetical protein